MTERKVVDASIARTVADIAGHMSDLQNAFEDIKWRLVRAEPAMMPVWKAKKAVNALKSELMNLQYRIDVAGKPDDKT